MIRIEAYVENVHSAREAEAAGADRLELCGPGEGGLTPSRALLASVLAESRIPVHAMIRPREGGFVYTDTELDAMREAVVMARNEGAHGAVFGTLHRDRTLDVDVMAELTALARPMRVACHRAFDATPDPERSLDQLMSIGVDLVLTSGHAPTALEGADTLARLVEQSAGAIVILAGGGVRARNAPTIIERSRVGEVHARASDAAVFAALVTEVRALDA